jgi:ATP-binding cassette subfamily F protein uup
MRVQRQERRKVEGQANLQLQTANRSGNLVAELTDVSFSHGDRPIVDAFSTTIMRGDKVGIIGRNGAGKTTLLRLMLGQLAPQTGQVRLGTNLEVAYFDQLRGQLDEEKSVEDNVADGNDRVQIGGKSKHIIGYLQDFLFTPERARTQVKFLSGGERNRVLLAKLMTRPANVIVLDEPTNDLDSETLDLLEARLVEFSGTLLVVSHDRTFLNNIVTSTIVFEQDGIREYVGGYDDWRRAVARRQQQPEADKATKSGTAATSQPTSQQATSQQATSKQATSQQATSQPVAGQQAVSQQGNGQTVAEKKKLSYKETRELAILPQRIETLEAEIASLHEAMAAADYYRRESTEIAADQQRLLAWETELADCYHRWEMLEARA